MLDHDKAWDWGTAPVYMTAAVMSALVLAEDHDAKHAGRGKSLHARLDVGHDNWLGAALRLAKAVAMAVDALIDWDAWGQREDCGVFTYDYIEFPGTGAPDRLGAYLLAHVTELEWVELACNFEPLTPARLEALVRDWAAQVGLACIPTTTP